MPDWVVALIGVVLGAALGEGVRSLREWNKRRRSKEMIKQELEAIKEQIPDKVNCFVSASMGQGQGII